MGTYVGELAVALEAVADPARSVAMAAYMKGSFEFFGVPAPLRRQTQRAVLRPADSEIFVTVRELWEQPQREMQYAAVDLLAARVRTLNPPGVLECVEELARSKSWWDTVDGLASVASSVLFANPDQVAVTERWIEDGNFWVVRIALLHQNSWGTKTDPDRLFGFAIRHASSPEFFIRKAIGWALRDYAWTEPHAVLEFVTAHREKLSPLSRREALKNLDHPKAGKLRRKGA